MRRAPPWPLTLALAIGLAARLVLAATHGPLASDERDYDALGWELASTGSYSEGGTPTAYRSIGYPAFIAGIYAIAGHSPRAVQVAQALLDLGTVILLYGFLVRRSGRAATWAAWLWSAYPAAVLFSGALLSETLYTFLLVALTVLLDRSRRRGSGTVLAGLVLGALVLVKPESLLFGLLLAGLLVQRGIGVRAAGALLASAAVVAIPWIARNSIVFGRPLVSTNLGPNLLIGNNPQATGAYSAALVPARVREARGEEAVDREARNAALEYIARRPDRFLALAPVKVAHVLSSDAELAVGRFTPRTDTAEPHREGYRSLPLAVHGAVSLPYFALVLAGIAGMVARPDGIERTVFAALVVSTLLVHVVTFGGSRFHFPWMPFFALFAARLAVNGKEGLRSAPPLARAAGAIAGAAFLAVWIAEAVLLSS